MAANIAKSLMQPAAHVNRFALKPSTLQKPWPLSPWAHTTTWWLDPFDSRMPLRSRVYLKKHMLLPREASKRRGVGSTPRHVGEMRLMQARTSA